MKIPQRIVKIAGINREVLDATESVVRDSIEGLLIAVQMQTKKLLCWKL